MMAKRAKITIALCFACNQNIGTTNTLETFLRDNEMRISFEDVVFLTLGMQVQNEAPNICNECKVKMIEFFHFKKRIQKNRDRMIQEIMKITSNFISKKDIKAVTIEESSDRLVIMEKSSSNQSEMQNNLLITNVSENVEFKLENENYSEIDDNIMDIPIKTEPIEEQPAMIESHQILSEENGYEEENLLNQESVESNNNKIDKILEMNTEILRLLNKLTDRNSDS